MSTHTPHVPLLVGVMGPTASGKTEVAERLADQMSALLVNADAFQIYRGMDIGTAKPIAKDRYDLIDIRDPREGFGVGEFVGLALESLRAAWENHRSVVVVGGTGLYVRALFEEYDSMSVAPDPELRKELDQLPLEVLVEELLRSDSAKPGMDLKNRVRVQRAVERTRCSKPSVPVILPAFKKIKLAVIPDPFVSSDRIAQRVELMVHNGWVREVQQLKDLGYQLSDPGLRALGYKSIWQHLDGEINLNEAVATTIAETRKYAKRQRTWLRSEPNLVVLDIASSVETALATVLL